MLSCNHRCANGPSAKSYPVSDDHSKHAPLLRSQSDGVLTSYYIHNYIHTNSNESDIFNKKHFPEQTLVWTLNLRKKSFDLDRTKTTELRIHLRFLIIPKYKPGWTDGHSGRCIHSVMPTPADAEHIRPGNARHIEQVGDSVT